MKTRKQLEQELATAEVKVASAWSKFSRAMTRLKKLWDWRKLLAKRLQQVKDDEQEKRRDRKAKRDAHPAGAEAAVDGTVEQGSGGPGAAPVDHF